MNRRTPMSYFVLVLSLAFALLWLSPFVLALFTSLKTGQEAISSSVFAPPLHPSLSNYSSFWKEVDFTQKLENSFVIAGGATALSMIISFFNAFALGLGRVKHRTWVLAFALIVFAIPQEAVVYAIFELALKLDIYATKPPLIFMLGVMYAGFGTFILAEVMALVPRELLEAARLDGARTRHVISRIVLPILGPTLIVVGLLIFIWDWNEYMMPLILLPDNTTQTVAMSVGYTFGGAGFGAYNFISLRSAAAILTAIPSVLFFFWFQRRVRRGVLAGVSD